MRIAAALLALCLLLLPASVASSQEFKPIALDLAGIGKPAVTLTAQNLAGLPTVEQDVSFMTSKGWSRGRYKGMLLWDVLSANGLAALPGHHEALRLTSSSPPAMAM